MGISLYSVNNFMFHLHNELELLIVLKGSIITTIGLEKYELFENDFIIVNRNEVHSSSRTNEENICLAIEINSSTIDRFYPEFSKVIFDCKSFEHELDKKHVIDKIRHHIASIIWGINKKDSGFQFDIWIHIINIAKELMSNFKSGEFINEDNKNNEDRTKRIQRIINFIDDKFEDGVTLDDIAKKEGMSSYYISRFIKDSIGITFQEYKNYKRLDKAEKLLLKTNDKITDIALSSGFPSAKSFNNIFFKYYSCSPTEFRKEKSSMTQSENYYICNDEQIKSKTYFDVDRKAAFTKLFTYLAPRIIDESTNPKTITNKKYIDVNMKSIPFAPNWKKLITSGRAAEGLRQDWRNHLEVVQKEIGFEYVRFHGIFSDEMMVCNLDEQNNIIYNWTYVDNLFDYLLKVNIKPFVELGFMPSELKKSDETTFWWKANVAQPRDINLWTELVKEFIRHCINRYGLKEVESWYFEVWNEPELLHVYWIGTKEEYFEFYKETALAVKSISKNLKVGGPSITHQALKDGSWLEDFITFCLDNDAPLDLITLHIYPESFAMDETDETKMDEIQKLMRDNGKDMNLNMMIQMKSQLKNIYYDKDHTIDTINDAIKRINTISPKKLELHITEWSSTAFGRNLISDTCYTAAFIVKNVLQSINTVDSLGYWTFTDILEELKAGLTPFHGGFGLLNNNGIKKPGYYAYLFLSKLGNEMLTKDENFIVTKKDDGIQLLAYNFAYFDDLFLKGDTSALTYKDRYNVFESKGNLEQQIELKGLSGRYKVTRYQLNRDHGSAFDEWLKLGSPENMIAGEIEYLKMKAHPKITTEHINTEDIYNLNISLPVHGLESVIIDKVY
jgi:xylan 1,4-beta-xylosidase